jgi:hypothetical protein
VKIGTQDIDNIIIVGSLLNVGTAFVLPMAATSTQYKTTSNTPVNTIFGTTTGGVASGNKAIIAAPANGMGQFKGLSTTTPASKYNNVICKSVVPFYATSYPQNLVAGDGNGWIIQCYTGIAQCA